MIPHRSRAHARAFALASFAAAFAACAPAPGGTPAATANGGAGSAGASPASAREVKTALAAPSPWERTVRVTGELVAFEQATLAAKVPGRLAPISFDLGTRVELGAVLAQVDPRDYELRTASAVAALQAARARLGLAADGDGDDVDPETTPIVRGARAELADAKRERDRALQLSQAGVGTQSVVDTAETRVLSAESEVQDALEEIQNRRALVAQRRAELALARQQQDDAVIRAPFAGVIAARLAATGDYLAAGAPIARVLRTDPVRLRLDVPEREAPNVAAGQDVRVLLEGARSVVHGRIARVSPEIGATNRTLRVEAELPNADGALRPGSFARAEIVVDPSVRALTIPATALVRFAGVDKVIAVENGKSVERRVTVGRMDAERVEILDGLSEGAEIVLEPGNLQGGSAVRVAR